MLARVSGERVQRSHRTTQIAHQSNAEFGMRNAELKVPIPRFPISSSISEFEAQGGTNIPHSEFRIGLRSLTTDGRTWMKGSRGITLISGGANAALPEINKIVL